MSTTDGRERRQRQIMYYYGIIGSVLVAMRSSTERTRSGRMSNRNLIGWWGKTYGQLLADPDSGFHFAFFYLIFFRSAPPVWVRSPWRSSSSLSPASSSCRRRRLPLISRSPTSASTSAASPPCRECPAEHPRSYLLIMHRYYHAYKPVAITAALTVSPLARESLNIGRTATFLAFPQKYGILFLHFFGSALPQCRTLSCFLTVCYVLRKGYAGNTI